MSLVGIDNYSMLMKEYFLCVFSLFMWKAADPRHYFNQGGRGYWWMHAPCRLVIHITSMQADDLDYLTMN